ncbi:MAG: clan AA aspartic protease [Candidatus Eremiobacteraeota bacterium]|nr:clan AA aspartic protease [Candidatus Eremiobacteraeota bacterium]
MKILAFALSALMLFGEAGIARADDASALLQKHKSFVGWQFGDGTFKSLAVDSELVKTDTNAVADRIHALNVGAIFRQTTQSAQGTEDDGFTGNIFWSTNINGFPRPVRGDEVQYIISQQILFNEATSELTGEARGNATVNGKQAQIVRVRPQQGDPIDLYVDPSTGEYVRATIDPDGTYERTIDILAYDEIAPGKKLISKWKYSDSSYEHRNTKVAVNPAFTNGDLHPPAQHATWDFRNSQPFKIRFLDRDVSPRIIVEAKVNGVPGRFILDTGASDIALTREFADRAGVKRLFKTQFGGIGGALRGEMAHADTIEIGRNVLHNVVVGAGGQPIEKEAPDGLMGFDLMAGAIVSVNLDDQTMTILDPKSNTVDRSNGITVAADLSNGTPNIPMKLNGNIDVNALLDSGAGTYVLYSTKLLNHGVRMLVDDSQLASHMVFGGVGGGLEVGACGNLDKISVGPIVYQNAPACQVRGTVGERDIIVGLDFLKGFNLLFDYPESYLVLIPRKQ